MGIGPSISPVMCSSCVEGVCCSGMMVFEDDEGVSKGESRFAGVRAVGDSGG